MLLIQELQLEPCGKFCRSTDQQLLASAEESGVGHHALRFFCRTGFFLSRISRHGTGGSRCWYQRHDGAHNRVGAWEDESCHWEKRLGKEHWKWTCGMDDEKEGWCPRLLPGAGVKAPPALAAPPLGVPLMVMGPAERTRTITLSLESASRVVPPLLFPPPAITAHRPRSHWRFPKGGGWVWMQRMGLLFFSVDNRWGWIHWMAIQNERNTKRNR